MARVHRDCRGPRRRPPRRLAAVEHLGDWTRLWLRPPSARDLVGEQSLYGHIRSLVRKGRRFELRLDPAWLLTGSTAARAALEDTGSSDVPNDSYTRDESHKLLTYRVPVNTPVTVLKHATCSTRVTLASLARTVPPAGFWVRVRGDTARTIDQQYHP